MRLTIDLIVQSPQFFSPSREWTLSMRGCKVDTIENMGTTQDYFEAIDLSDNEIIRLENFPPLNRLSSLMACNNRISRIDDKIASFLPQLKSLVLTNNKLDRLTDLEPIFHFKFLERLCLIDNPVCSSPYYRLYLIYYLPKLKYLDFMRVRAEERQQAKATFKGDKGLKLLSEIAPIRKTVDNLELEATEEKQKDNILPPEQMEKIKKAIANANSIEVITRLEEALRSGRLPDDLDTLANASG